MHKCPECDKTFKTIQALNAHKVAHKKGKRYSVSRQKNPKTYECINCGENSVWNRSKINKYCSNKCQVEYQYKHIHRPNLEKGLIKDGSPILKRFLTEVYGEFCSECGIGPEYNGKPLCLEVDHIDGVSDNNLPENLRLLCPNCHSQTETYKAKNNTNTNRSKYRRLYRSRMLEKQANI